jgi:hypothetical protein
VLRPHAAFGDAAKDLRGFPPVLGKNGQRREHYMKRIILLLLLAALAWYGWGKYQDRAPAQREAELASRPVATKALPLAKARDPAVSFFTCDGRSSCKQMTSCEEARYFVKTCPGFGAGVSGEEASCETQWCKN